MEFFTHHFDNTEACFLLALASILQTKNSSLVTSLERSSIVASSAENSSTLISINTNPGSFHSERRWGRKSVKRTEKKRGEVDNSTRRDRQTGLKPKESTLNIKRIRNAAGGPSPNI